MHVIHVQEKTVSSSSEICSSEQDSTSTNNSPAPKLPTCKSDSFLLRQDPAAAVGHRGVLVDLGADSAESQDSLCGGNSQASLTETSSSEGLAKGGVESTGSLVNNTGNLQMADGVSEGDKPGHASDSNLDHKEQVKGHGT